ncbi:hypothetical protein [Burkholderia sp. BC1]|uniref:hypothetical protein n=1 Tax=Burkholderia sp. BC1 TaxID=1095370 RepID=UPI004044565E
MKATILSDGTLQILPESDLDAYALGQWSRVNFGDGFNACVPCVKIMIDLSGYPAALAPLHIPKPQPGRRTQP